MAVVTVSGLEAESSTPLVSHSGALRVWEERFTRRISEWDRHVESCPICLVEGTILCFEGEHLAELVGEARERLAVEQMNERRAGLPARRLTPA